MRDQPDEFIEGLVSNLQPMRPMRLWPLWLGATACLLLAATYIYFAYGPRDEMAALLQGRIINHPVAFLKPAMFMLIGAASLWSVGDLAKPQGRLRAIAVVPLILCLIVITGALGREIADEGAQKTFSHLQEPMLCCFLTIFIGGMLGLAIMYGLWLRRAATSFPVALGAMSGLAAASFMAAAYAVHCPLDSPIYILLMYGLPVVCATLVSASLGRVAFKW